MSEKRSAGGELGTKKKEGTRDLTKLYTGVK
jgi:hypothetical protein